MLKYSSDNLKNKVDTLVFQGYKICVYGLGQICESLGLEFVSYLTTGIDYATDKDISKVINDKRFCDKLMTLETLLTTEEQLIVFVLVGNQYCDEIVRSLSNNKNLECITWKDLCADDWVLSQFFKIAEMPKYSHNEKYIIPYKQKIDKKKKIAVYTCITGGYDDVPKIKFKDDSCDYYLISEKAPNNEEYKFINVEDVVPKGVLTAKDKNRYCKSHGYEIFKEYDYSIYFDGNIEVIGPISEMTNLVSELGLAFHKHPYVTDAYCELARVVGAGRAEYADAIKAGRWLSEKKCPRHILCLDCNVIVCENQNPNAAIVLSDWFDLYIDGDIKRDQIYMTYNLWSKGIEEKDIGIIHGTVDGDDGYVQRKHAHYGL